jgi:ferritin-like protein
LVDGVSFSTKRSVMKRTSLEWWTELKKDPEKLVEWLKKQYYGEATAAGRIKRYVQRFLGKDDPRHRPLTRIMADETKHARWVLELLTARGVKFHAIPNRRTRYWEEVDLERKVTFEEACGVSYHAEHMRLERIKVIAEDTEGPEDIRKMFKLILEDEIFHERLFEQMAGTEAVNATREGHLKGAEAIGFISQEMV